MSTETKIFNCKNEELPVIGRFVLSNLKIDLPAFTAFSPEINQEYVAEFEAHTVRAENLVSTKSKMTEVKASTMRLYSTMESITDPLNRLAGYINMAKLPITLTAFGITGARRKITSKDAEGLMHQLQAVSTNIEKNKEILLKKGLTEEAAKFFIDVRTQIAADNLLQYEVVENRKQLVQQNKQVLNELYKKIAEVCNIGKILFKNVDAVKLKQYTFSQLIKRVRVVPLKQTEAADKN